MCVVRLYVIGAILPSLSDSDVDPALILGKSIWLGVSSYVDVSLKKKKEKKEKII